MFSVIYFLDLDLLFFFKSIVSNGSNLFKNGLKEKTFYHKTYIFRIAEYIPDFQNLRNRYFSKTCNPYLLFNLESIVLNKISVMNDA